MNDFDMHSASQTLHDFEQQTGILQSYIYNPLMPITLPELLDSGEKIEDTLAELLASRKHILTQKKLPEVQKIRANK